MDKERERERTIYQLVAIGCFFALIFVGHKYIELRHAYQKAETNKVDYCKKYHKLKCVIENQSGNRNIYAEEN